MSAPDNPQFDPQSFDSQPGVNHEPSAPSEPGAPDSLISSSLEVPPPVVPPAGPPPVEDPAWNGWDVLAIIGLALVTILASQAVILFGAHFLFYRGLPLTDLAQKPLLLLVSQFVIDAAVAIYLFLWIEGKYRVPFWRAILWNWPKGGWRLLALGALMLLALSMLENLLPMPKDTPFEKLFANPLDGYLLAIIAVTLGPLVEELFFRGFLYPVLARRWGVTWGILLTALPFAAMHLPQYGYAWGALLVILIVGIVCGAVRAVTKSVGASFLVHVGYNGTQMLLALLLTRGFTHMPKGLLEY